MDTIRLIITDNGDTDCGLFPQSWEVEVPFTEPHDYDGREFFRNAMIAAYSEYCDGKCTAVYDFEYTLNDFAKTGIFL